MADNNYGDGAPGSLGSDTHINVDVVVDTNVDIDIEVDVVVDIEGINIDIDVARRTHRSGDRHRLGGRQPTSTSLAEIASGGRLTARATSRSRLPPLARIRLPAGQARANCGGPRGSGSIPRWTSTCRTPA